MKKARVNTLVDITLRFKNTDDDTVDAAVVTPDAFVNYAEGKLFTGDESLLTALVAGAVRVHGKQLEAA